MKLVNSSGRQRLPIEDYSAAIRRAVSWLGDRYLIATPVARRTAKPQALFPSRYFSTQGSWYERSQGSGQFESGSEHGYAIAARQI